MYSPRCEVTSLALISLVFYTMVIMLAANSLHNWQYQIILSHWGNVFQQGIGSRKRTCRWDQLLLFQGRRRPRSILQFSLKLNLCPCTLNSPKDSYSLARILNSWKEEVEHFLKSQANGILSGKRGITMVFTVILHGINLYSSPYYVSF